MRTIISILLALVLLLSRLPGQASRSAGPDRQEAQAVMADTVPANRAVSAAAEGTDWADMDYRRYDPDWFYDQTDRLAALGAQDDPQAVMDLYDRLYRELDRIDTLSAIAYIRYCADVTDEYWSGESIYAAALLTEAADALSGACHAVMEGPCAEAFSAHVGADAADAFAEYVPMTVRETELTRREAELVDQYNAVMNDADAVTYSYLGRTWTWDMVAGFPGASLASRDHDGYLEVYYGLQKGLNDLAGPIFTQLVSIRAELARLQGFQSYADLAYEQIYGRDYGAEEAQLLCDGAKELGRTFYQTLRYSDLWYQYGSVRPVMDGQALLDTLGRYVGRIDPSLSEAWQFMCAHGLYDIAGGEDRFPGSFTSPLNAYDSAFIYSQLSGDCRDLGTLAHEFGHFAYDRLHPDEGPLAGADSFDLLEIHSTGLETLLTAYYDEIYTEGSDIARFLALGDLMQAVLEGCVYDEFQRRIYAQPDMTLEEMNRLFASIRAEYGMDVPRDEDYSWMYVSHNFESPLYYISYAVSALAVIQIWDLAREDWQAGVDAWKQVMDADARSEGYMTVLPACGLRLFTEPGAVEDICRPLLGELERLDAGT